MFIDQALEVANSVLFRIARYSTLNRTAAIVRERLNEFQ
ncbi:MAG: hypothetical protein OFPI_03590 [Osedax symbiont Rs2]|nr:MAG: hypothetical protein OFPI_03590 [Osedax symbiont Rs2]